MNIPIQSAEVTVTNEGNRAMSSIQNFLNSNTLVSKVVFIILIVIGFVVTLQIGTTLLGYIFEPTSNPVLVSGMKDAKKVLIIPQDPKNPNSIPVMRSTNQDKGLEFTWTVWLYLDDLVYKNGQKKHIFHKGSGNFKDHIAFPNNGPGLYIHPTRNSLIVVMNTFKNIMEGFYNNQVLLWTQTLDFIAACTNEFNYLSIGVCSENRCFIFFSLISLFL